MRGIEEQPVLIFVHLPKCGGTTLNRLLEWEYGLFDVFVVDGRFYRWSYNKLIKTDMAKFSQMRVFRGHMPFGIHRLLDRPVTYMTVVRDPIDRLISEYYYRKGRWQHQYEDHQMKRQTLEEYITKNPQQNLQTKLLAGQVKNYDFLAERCDATTLEVAKENLERYFSLVGLTERFEQSLALAKLAYGWEIRRYTNFRVNPGRPSKDKLSDAIKSLIAEHNHLDVELYKYSTNLFERAVETRKAEVEGEVAKIRQARVHNPIEEKYFRTVSWLRENFIRLRCASMII